MDNIPVIAIDFGSSYSRVAVCQNGQVSLIPNELGITKTPSYVSFTEKERLVGLEAKKQFLINSKNTIFNIKRLLAESYDDYFIQQNKRFWPFKLVEDPKSDRLKISISYKEQEKTFYPESIAAILLKKLKEFSSKFLGKEVKDAILTVPTFFTSKKIKSLKYSCMAAGLNVI